jgi:hypothetical protein
MSNRLMTQWVEDFVFKRILTVCGILALVSIPSLADIYGTNPLAAVPAGGINDYCTGCLFAYTQAPNTADGQIFTSWAFDTVTTVNNNGVGGGNGVITPLLFSNNFTLVGIGTTQTVSPNEQVSFVFGLTQGTNIVAAGDYFGWADGSAASGDNGIIALTGLSGGPGVFTYTCGNVGTNGAAGPCFNTGGFSLNTNYGPALNLAQAGSGQLGMYEVPGRTYEVNFTTAAATPEPGFLGLVTLGLIGLVTVAIRRKKVPQA